MKKYFLFLLMIIGIVRLQAQTNAVLLEEAVHTYNAMRDFEDGLKPGKVTESDIERLKADIASGRPKLLTVMANGTPEEAKCARYFNANFSYELGFIYGMMGRNKDAYELLNTIKTDYAYFTSDKFPMNYTYEGKNYAVKYANFEPTQNEYHTGMAEICANLSKYEESLEWARKSLNASNTGPWFKYISLNKIIEVKGKLNQVDQELLDKSLEQINAYAVLDTSYKRSVKENNYPTQRTGYEKIKSVLKTKPELAKGGYYYASAAPVLYGLKDVVNAADAYERALDAGYSSNRFYDDAITFARNENEKQVGLKACAMKESFIGSTDCAAWADLAKAWDDFGNSSKAAEARYKAKSCEDERRDREAKAEAERKRRERRENRTLGVYAGFYPGPLLTRFAHYRDFGGVAGITLTQKMAIEFSYKSIHQNHVLMEDLAFKSVETNDNGVKWDGMKTHVAFKFRSGNEAGFYLGPLFGYVKRTLNPINSEFTNTATSLYYPAQNFHATEKSYELLLNYGIMQINKHFMFDMFFSIGAAYHQFDISDAIYDNDTYTYTHPLLESRSETRIGPVIRMGMTLGLASNKKYWR